MPYDDLFIAKLKRGGEGAIERLVADFEGPLYRYFLAVHGDASLAGEQSADTFSELVRALPKLRGGASQLRGFVYAVARNVERRRWRERWRADQPIEAAGDSVSNAPAPDQVAESREELQRTLAVLRGMDSTTREVFVLAFVEQLSLGEVASTLGLPLGTVKSRIHRGRKQLEELLPFKEGMR